MPKLEWVDWTASSKLSGKATLWFDMSRGEWVSNTPPLSGSWPTREEGKAALVKALRDQYTELLASLPEEE